MLAASTLAQIGEDQLVATLIRSLPLGSAVRVGPGDDCAVLGRPRDRVYQLLKTDAVVEGIHFLPEDDYRRVGWKALCRAISDIAAMGGLPEHAVVTLAAHPEVPLAQLQRLYSGLIRAARRYELSIVGGETSRSPGPLFINIALTGRVERTRCVLRSGGRPGDRLFVTGRLGGSRVRKHLDFFPRLAEARWLTQNYRPRAMMDLSDGLGADLPRLAKASGCGFTLDYPSIPRTRGSSLAQALSDGEDYELLFAIAPTAAQALLRAWPKTFPKLSDIGVLTREPLSTPPPHGFDHFAPSR